ncbi:MAG: isochorismate synthase DhbC [Bacillus sp. (in: firmicutes)]
MIQHTATKIKQKQIIDDYETGDFFLASPNRTLLGKGIFAQVPTIHEIDTNKKSSLSQRVKTALNEAENKGYQNPYVVGAIPFNPEHPDYLIIPKQMTVSMPLQHDAIETKGTSSPSVIDLQSIPQTAQYVHNVNQGIELIKNGQLDKIVLARALHVTASKAIEITPLLRQLAAHNSAGYTFSVDLSHSSKDKSNKAKTLIGASPELLVSKSGNHLTANPLAGSRPRSADPLEDQRRAHELLHSSKDLHEHAVVVENVADILRPFCEKLEVPETPSLVQTETMWHLSTEVKGIVADDQTTSLDVAVALHPTPAVCGSPTEAARQAITEIEPFDRSFFTGMLGWCSANGDGEWIVTIRCAEVDGQEMRLFAGAGIVEESQAQLELAETAAKFRTMLLALGLDDELSI